MVPHSGRLRNRLATRVGGDYSRGQRYWHTLPAEEATEEVESYAATLPAGPPHRHEHLLRPGTGPRTIAAPNFAENHAEAHRLLGTPIGGVETVLVEEG